ncbi:MAG: hypothetical protein IKC69_02530 [Clostridia bacterium]|nr:hypothetical protein [Clostridia bacterium]
MKRMIAMLISLCMLFSLAACGLELNLEVSVKDKAETETETFAETATADVSLEETATLPIDPETREPAETKETDGTSTPTTPTPNGAYERLLVGDRRIFVDMGSYFEEQFQNTPLDSYMQYEDMTVRMMDATFKADGTGTMTFLGKELEQDFNDVVEILLQNLESFCTAAGMDFASIIGAPREAYAASMKEQLAQQLAPLQGQDGSTDTFVWHVVGNEIVIQSSDGEDLNFTVESESGGVFVCKNESFQGIPLLIVKR